MKIKLFALIAALTIGLSTAGGVALASNPHCLGNSDNARLPNHHTQQNFPACD